MSLYIWLVIGGVLRSSLQHAGFFFFFFALRVNEACLSWRTLFIRTSENGAAGYGSLIILQGARDKSRMGIRTWDPTTVEVITYPQS